MPYLHGFTDNPFETRSDLVRAAVALLSALEPYKSKGKARIKISTATAAGFDETAAQLEGFARPLWVVPFLLNESASGDVGLESWIHGLQAGTHPESPEYWGDLGDFDQRMVEMESIACALLARRDLILGTLSDATKANLANWLRQINHNRMPQNNWLWFRVFVNLALVKALGVPQDELQAQIDSDLKTLDSFRLGEGWSSDGLWGDERKQADYYSGSFAIQFAQLLYIQFAGEDDKTRAEMYRQSARDFGSTFWRYFDKDGAAIPFGRSMTYRFAFAAFWSALACAGVQLPAPIDNIGIAKGLLLRHLRWWSKQPDIFNSDGTLNIGFTYPNMYLSENYNSPQSVYWCLKSFIVLMLPEEHKFWTAKESPYPSLLSTTEPLSQLQVVWPPRHILCTAPEHHFFLSSGQMTKKSHKAREAKYGKFAYSSAFGFSVPCGPLLEQLAPDSTLSVTHDGGETWKVRAEPSNEKILQVSTKISGTSRTVSALASQWQPWKYLDFTITTVLVPLAGVFPGWHVRMHRVKSKGFEPSRLSNNMALEIVDSGFALDAETAGGGNILPTESWSATEHGYSADSTSCLLRSRAGTVGIVDLAPQMNLLVPKQGNIRARSEAFVLRADPNTNLIASRTFIPSIRHKLSPSTPHPSEVTGDREWWLATGVFAIAGSASIDRQAVLDMWRNQPRLSVGVEGEKLKISVLTE
ncbi:hypothetical protein BJX63DRAFT_432700 [Aspergillus granulosus]|uniref:DUF2264 domain-containing protein n=1 Tax=Aspergillus granulosus TaxID=176169 RepID=A0ABR4H9V8_9EURO